MSQIQVNTLKYLVVGLIFFVMYDLVDERMAQAETPRISRERFFYLAAPQNLNPGLRDKPVEIEVEEEPAIAPELELDQESETPTVPLWRPESITVDFKDNVSNFGQDNQFIEPTVTGILPNGDRLSITSGFNQFQQPGINSIQNIPLKLDWEGEIAGLETSIGGGIDWFDEVPLALNFRAQTSVPIGKKAKLSFHIEHSPYKFNAETIQNEIKSWRYGPNLFWQISPDTTLFSLVRWGRYNDGNNEQQSFSRLEHTRGEFKVAANLFNWRYREDNESVSGYFSPLDFLVANGEIVWEKDIFDWLSCRAAASAGQQHSEGEWTFAYGYNGKCTTKISDNVEWDLGYNFSNIPGEGGNSIFNDRTWSSQLRAKF